MFFLMLRVSWLRLCIFDFVSSFHTYDYARHFVSACTRILGLEGTPEGVEDQGQLTRVAAVYESFINSLKSFFFFLFSSLALESSFLFCKRLWLTHWLDPLDEQFPIGIDSDRFIRALELPAVKYHIKELQERFAGRKVCSSINS